MSARRKLTEEQIRRIRTEDKPHSLRGQNCRCAACGLLFRAVSSFDLHRVGPMRDRRCLTSMELAGKGWAPDSKGFWRRPGRKVNSEFVPEMA